MIITRCERSVNKVTFANCWFGFSVTKSKQQFLVEDMVDKEKAPKNEVSGPLIKSVEQVIKICKWRMFGHG